MILSKQRAALALVTFTIAGAALAANPAPRTWCETKMVAGRLRTVVRVPDIGVVVRQYDGLGGIEQWDNVKGEVTGYTPGRYGRGTYRVNDDCTVDIEFHPAPNVTLQERGVVVDNGNEIRTITVLPAGTMVTATHQRI
jgi:hypothetical protein